MEKQMDLFKEEEIEQQIIELKKDLNYDTRDYPIEFLVSLYENDSRIFAPDYQREELLWSILYKSRFIESIILDYPIPLIFLADTKEGGLEIIDGLQRISTLAEFLNNDFELEKLKKLTTLNGCSCLDLPASEIRRLKAKALRIIVLKDSTPNEVRKDLFDRLNTSSLLANPSEIRSGRESDNELMQLVKELKNNPQFIKTTNLSNSLINRKEDIELISRFFAYSNNLSSYRGHVANFIDKYFSTEGKNLTQDKKQFLRSEFLRTMDFVDTYFERGFQKEGRNQTPRVRFEALAIGINLALRENPKLSMSQEKARILLESESFKQWTTTDAANNRNKINSRINGVKEFLLTGKIDE
ncbi:DUF262 domain-containing protein [Lactococcus lactis]|uniref:GmrSD restriction endonucleases N-terminal domain-containing protein n=1 Tax=Lactococcus lactis subsp. lactis TaxID=1360 RepID=A0A0V8EM10_LACLL|nr:DUF262 domain-containing protein [Lactococcus lactis]KSU26871.1 hypothetical protein N42_1406 [Lactococcus lactis subsp. lactis]TRW67786.1 DUF262 domain-containing protein [Lactococcus lactis]